MGRSKDLATGETRFANVSGDTFTGLVNITNTYSSDTTEQLRVSDNTGSKLDFFGHAIGTKSIQAYADDGSTFYNLNLQPLGGYVTTPNQPYFAVEMRNNGNYQSQSAGTALPFNSVALNTVSGSYDGSNYRYTAPVSGKYLMIAGGITNQADPTGRLQFYVNGSNEYTGQGSAAIKYGINGSNTAGGGSCLTSAIIPMTANDYVDVRSSSGTTYFYEHDHSFWTGMLLG